MVIIDFITKSPRTTRQHDSIMVVVDTLSKDGHFIPVRSTHKVANLEDNYMKEIARLYHIPKTIISDRDSKFTSNSWRGLLLQVRI